MHRFHSPLDLVRTRSCEQPVACIRPDAVTAAANWFRTTFEREPFPTRVLYAVKANPDPWVLDTLWAAGIRSFDVASLPEIADTRAQLPDADLAFMHPVKSRESIRRAYYDYGVRTFAIDSMAELVKIETVLGGARDINLIVRLAVSTHGANLPLVGKFGCSGQVAADVLLATRNSTDGLVGISFHVGSQCMRPTAYRAAMAQAQRIIVAAGVMVDIVDVGGGFPSVYPGMTPPPLDDYAKAILDGFEDMSVSEHCELWCEPGRALVAESTSVLTRVELRKDDALYLNDGSYGTLFDATHVKWQFPVKMHRGRDSQSDTNPSRVLKPFRFYGPTCDSIDHMPGPFWLPQDINEGDIVEIGMLGAYGTTMATRFNGFGTMDMVRVDDAPMSSMYGLAPAHLPTPREADTPVVIKFTRAKNRKRKKR